jgi:hypothetical protein
VACHSTVLSNSWNDPRLIRTAPLEGDALARSRAWKGGRETSRSVSERKLWALHAVLDDLLWLLRLLPASRALTTVERLPRSWCCLRGLGQRRPLTTD